jgi:hypothetical protein
MSIITGGRATEKAWKKVNYIVVRLNVMCANGTAVEGVCVTRCNPPVDCPGCEQGKSPGGPPGMARYLQSRVRLVLRSCYDDASL